MATHNLEHLRTFLTVYRVGSLTEAARLLGISQPTASTHVHSLEQNLGLRLFERSPTGVAPTPKAEGLARDVGPHIDALDDLAFMSSSSGANGSIHLGGPAEFITTLLLPHTPELTEAIGAKLLIRFGLVDGLLDELRSGDLDIVVSAVRPRVQGVTGIPLFDEEFVLVAAPLWKASITGVDPADVELSAIPVVAYAENLPIVRRYWRTVFDRRPDDLRTSCIVPDLRGVRAAILAGAGMSVLPSYLVEDDLSTGALTTLHTPEFAPLNTVYLATRTGDLDRNRQLRSLASAIQRRARF
ncbi:LysR family transcriptional regulator [Paenarthrobacter aurescens]|jgi:DNA-binding transcriptional LysR family regulator|uniref:Transcriptional regulator, LysR family n=1 Tax=Paenarthrobacter aurescens (strain TC1) TaxID=290340 RepID=A1R366_PAEAT|nr:LysR family transcriptional regulator [Paenarthrobacter aurescens]ABM09063.1 putative transcriptional regulator, LysR family [Paenarthrobacter aurescens TC1]